MTRTTGSARALILASTAALALALSGCGSTEPEASSAAPETELLAQVETNYGVIDVPQPEDGELTVVALGWSDGEVALSLGVKPVAIYDWQSFGAENKGVGPWATEAFGSDEPTLLTSGGDALDYETIQLLEPDLILNVRAALDDEVHERLSDIAPTISAPKGTPDFSADWRTQTEIIAQALGKEEEGQELIDGFDALLKEQSEAHPEFAGKTLVSGSKFGEAYGASLPGDSRFDLFAELGFVLNPDVAALDNPGGFFAPISAEQIAAFNADVAVITTIGYPLSEVEADPLIQSLDVVKDGRAIFADPAGDFMSGATAGTVASLQLALDDMLPRLEAVVPTD